VAADTATKPRQPKPDRASRRRGPVLFFGAGARRSAALRYFCAPPSASCRPGRKRPGIHRCLHSPGRRPNAWNTATSRTPDRQPKPRATACSAATAVRSSPNARRRSRSPHSTGHPVGVVMAMRLRHAIPLRLVGFADALNPWASYRNHPVVRTPGGSACIRPTQAVGAYCAWPISGPATSAAPLWSSSRQQRQAHRCVQQSGQRCPLQPGGDRTRGVAQSTRGRRRGCGRAARTRPRQPRQVHSVLVALNLRTRPVPERRTGIGLTGSAASSVSSCPRRIILTFSPSPTCSSRVRGPSRAS